MKDDLIEPQNFIATIQIVYIDTKIKAISPSITEGPLSNINKKRRLSDGSTQIIAQNIEHEQNIHKKQNQKLYTSDLDKCCYSNKNSKVIYFFKYQMKKFILCKIFQCALLTERKLQLITC
ncbi:hypothetical protein RFI_39202 [Reticulomyxa filosa]|uniref:Uncharacterized protein n=1 Tax=Reticulomyxa filosa TaxID=46433 RepID=X6L9U9_RETFI|nr:hypothetical protein RFI_39202 [Reticulomyxa filosa]|eukprot:ETN98308.1 hypothetical protein RFI_39202 [Reticulomyxa filosa]